MRKYTVTLVFTVIAIVLCFLHYFNFDPKHMLLFSFSVPLWFLPALGDVRTIPPFILYLLTIASWAVMGYIVDRLYSRYLQQERARK